MRGARRDERGYKVLRLLGSRSIIGAGAVLLGAVTAPGPAAGARFM